MGTFDALVDESDGATGEAGSSASGKICSVCGETKGQDAFSNKQWSAKAHSRKCQGCVANPPETKAMGEPLSWTRSGGDNASALYTPPPWYDENAGPEFLGENMSMVFSDDYKSFLLDLQKGEVGPDDDLVKPEFRHIMKTGMTGLQSAAAMADIPMMKAMLRAGARIDRFAASGSCLQMLVGMMLMQGEMVKGEGAGAANGVRSRLKAVEFLLSVGANPNAKPDMSLGDANPMDGGMFLSATPLHLAVIISTRDSQLAKPVCELLLQHKADPKAIYDGKTVLECCQSAGFKMTLKALIKRYQDTPRPAALCPCGSGRLFDACHGHRTGAPLHPRALCPCKSDKNLAYGECCLAAGKMLRETIPTFELETPLLLSSLSVGKK